ncbi:MAG: DUF177 domain-containing protein [Clostridiales bacterium]|jgi:uncharacterized protein|nr:DUF177 domain-containing protein [Eubacteriales bacterium]MDH7566676.1 DUF177 domain-containing protein [Clostridiales bacterium]
MKVNISDILKKEGASLNIEFNEKMEELNSIDPGTVFGEPVVFKGNLVNIGGVLKLRGRLYTRYTAKCYRCLKDVTCSVDVDVTEDYISAEKNQDADAYTYEGSYIVIDKAFIDNIILNLPMKKVCSESCKGLCPMCGTDLNVSECGCKDNPMNLQMEILKNLLNN